MAATKPQSSGDTAYGEQYEVIQAPRALQAKAPVMTGAEADKFNPIGAAEDALQKLSIHFDEWLDDQITVLRAAHAASVAAEFSPSSIHEIFRAAHDLRGHAATLGFPLAGEIAGSLCHIFDYMPPGGGTARELVRLHVEAIRAVVAEKAVDAEHPVGKPLVESLRWAAEDYAALQSGRTAA
jgi:chemotaxis protein histidine kinase CheA